MATVDDGLWTRGFPKPDFELGGHGSAQARSSAISRR